VAPDAVIDWLLAGDPSVEYQARLRLLGESPESLAGVRGRIATEGWGARFLAARDPATGLWGEGLYAPKWVSTHYTLLDLMALGMDPATPGIQDSAAILLDGLWPVPGPRTGRRKRVDTCVAAMLLSIGVYARLGDRELPRGRSERAVLHEILDHLLEMRLADGGWNCQSWSGDTHSSLHTTISVAEAMRDWAAGPDQYRVADALATQPGAWEFLWRHRMSRSERTGQVIDHRMETMPFPTRWYYDTVRGLAYLASVGAPWDPRMADALARLVTTRDADGRWPLSKGYSNKTHFSMERVNSPSRWNTLRALLVLDAYGEHA
jgi:hypothetical protein